MLGYFRARPVVFTFSFDDVIDDVNYVREKYFSNKKMSNHDLSATTKTKLINRLFKYTGYYTYRSSVDKNGLLDRLNDVAKISVEPRYIFDECLSYFGQNTLALAGYTTLQDVISSVLSIERRRIDDILNKHLSSHTKETLLNLLRSNNTFTELSKIKRVAKDFSQSQITQELKTHSIIRNLYPIVKTVISELALSPKNLEYYATLVRHKSVYKLRRHEDNQTLLYLICYLFFRYREINDNLVAAFVYSVRKLNDAAKTFAKQRISDDFDTVKTQLKSAGNLLKYFVDGAIEDDLSCGEVRKKAFKLISAKNIQLLSEHLDTNDFDGRKYEWQYIDTQTNKIRNLLRLLFLAIDVEFSSLTGSVLVQFQTARAELGECKALKTIDVEISPKNDKPFLHPDNHKNAHNRFEFFLYKKAEQLFQNNQLTVKESVNNRSLHADLIQAKDWKRKDEIIQSTGLEKLKTAINQTLDDKIGLLTHTLEQASHHIFKGDNQYVELVPGKAELKWSIPNKRWQETVENPIYNQIKHMGIVELMLFVHKKTGFLKFFSHISLNKEKSAVD